MRACKLVELSRGGFGWEGASSFCGDYGLNVSLCHPPHLFNYPPYIQKYKTVHLQRTYQRMKTLGVNIRLRNLVFGLVLICPGFCIGVCDLSTVSLCIGILILQPEQLMD